jgi:hypothetical protein
LLKEYGQVTQQFRELTQIRFKLLAFLPLGTIGTLGILKSQHTVPPAPFALFGFFVTLALFVYNLRNDQHYDELVGRAAQIERDLKLFDGSFAQRPDKWHRLGPGVYVEHRWPIHLVYVASAALWLWMILSSLGQSWIGRRSLPPDTGDSNSETALAIASVTIAVVFAVLLMWHLSRSRKASSARYRHAVRDAMELLVNASVGPEAEQRAADVGRALALRLGGGLERARRFESRVLFYLGSDNEREFLPRRKGMRLDVRTASYILGYTIDMPARWIRDIFQGRRGS